MALRLRKDVQKASYYVWFLGAEEARGLRGPRVLLPAIPNLIERSREQEPLKVTLQVSQKGMKIVQGNSKHFITHSAITCSVQAEDIVACVLLLYNPTTKCPLHVHAYRCDSETTAQALHQFLQVLINRAENQKRFSELETRLGLQSMAISAPIRPVQPEVFSPVNKLPTETKTTVRRFESSLGSDTGTSTRESECSEELGTPVPKSSLYDSLAAELRAKLNGNGPPLLLPPRDYDTVHRSKGNLAATELRRCRNSLIVGDKVTKPQPQTALMSSRSRGSSGIGSDLAPSPERPEEHSSSEDDDWVQENNHQRQPEPKITKHQPRKLQLPRQPSVYPTAVPPPPLNAFTAPFAEEPISPLPSYLYPLSRDAVEPYPYANDAKRHVSRSTSREKSANPTLLHRSVSQDEADIKPIIIRPRNYDSRFKHILDENKFHPVDDAADNAPQPLHKPIQAKPKVERKIRNADEMLAPTSGRYADEEHQQQQQPHRYRYGEEEEQRKVVVHNNRSSREALNVDRSSSERDLFRENLTDREKYRESQKYHGQKDQFDGYDHRFERRLSPPRKAKYPVDNGVHSMEKAQHSYVEPKIADRSGFRHHRDGYENSVEHHDAKLSRSFTEKPIKGDYDQSMLRNPYKEPESLPYRESIESMIKSPAMRYKSFEASPMLEGTKLTSAQPNYPAPEKVRDPSIRYHSLEAEKYMAEQKSKYGPEPAGRRRAIEKKRSTHNGSPDTVCRVSPKDRFNNAREKFEAMDRERSYAQADTRQQQQVRQMEPPNHQQRHQSPPRRDRSQNQQRYPSHETKVDWSSDDEQQQHIPARPTTNKYRDAAIGPDGYGDHFRAMGPSKSLNNLAHRGGYRHSYAEPVRAQLPRNSGRVGLAAVNPY